MDLHSLVYTNFARDICEMFHYAQHDKMKTWTKPILYTKKIIAGKSPNGYRCDKSARNGEKRMSPKQYLALIPVFLSEHESHEWARTYMCSQAVDFIFCLLRSLRVQASLHPFACLTVDFIFCRCARWDMSKQA